MNELMNTQGSRRKSRWQLLATVSAVALAQHVVGMHASAASDDADRPTVWIELGGQLQRIDDGQQPFSPKFTLISPTPTPYQPISPQGFQRPARYAFGGEGKISFVPKDSYWVFSAGVRYGRSNANRSRHQQTGQQQQYINPKYRLLPTRFPTKTATATATKNAETDYRGRSSYTIVDFKVGKDVGLGMFGSRSTSLISGGIRVAEFGSQSHATIKARPEIEFFYSNVGALTLLSHRYDEFVATGDMAHRFHGVGPSLSWDNSVPFAGNGDDGEVAFDWGVNAAVLFGRQKTHVSHQTTAYHAVFNPIGQSRVLSPFYNNPSRPFGRSRSAVVPNVGGFAGVSFQFPDAKVSLGYRADFFFGAMDGGIAARKTYDRNFYGPFASIGIGLGG